MVIILIRLCLVLFVLGVSAAFIKLVLIPMMFPQPKQVKPDAPPGNTATRSDDIEAPSAQLSTKPQIRPARRSRKTA